MLDGLELLKAVFHVNAFHTTELSENATEEERIRAAAIDAVYNNRLLEAITSKEYTFFLPT